MKKTTKKDKIKKSLQECIDTLDRISNNINDIIVELQYERSKMKLDRKFDEVLGKKK